MGNKDYIKDLFDNDGIKAPDSLSEDNILKMLEEADAPQAEDKGFKEASPKRNFRIRPENMKVLAAAAAVLIAVFGITALSPLYDTAPDTSVKDGSLYTFRSASEIKRTIRSLSPGSLTVSNGPVTIQEDFSASGDAEARDSADSAGLTAGAESAAKSSAAHSDTYLQVDDVDEADIVKTDGRYIYYVNRSQEVVILEAKDGKTKKLTSIGSSGIENYVSDIYLSGDRLITIGHTYRSDDDDQGSTGVVVYDITDRSKPVMLSDFRQSGDIVSSRMVGDYVYLVTSDYVYRGGRMLPYCGSGDEISSLTATDISCLPDPKSASYIVLSSIDTASGSQGRSATKAVLGASSDIYCNDHALYCASSEYDSDKGAEYTRIARASIDGLDVKFDATAKVRGRIVNQFAMDEDDGYFRIATTSDRSGMNVNNLYVLDSSLKEAGKVTGFARNESIKSVRFMGDKAYVITYEAIDPLFVIDLSDPAAPRIEGEVKIDGFSTLLVPAGKGRLLGIGHATGGNGYGGQYASGLKIALFDISDPSEPKVLDSREFEGMSSPAQTDHHALMVNSDQGYFAVPYGISPDSSGGSDVIIEDDIIDAETAKDSLTDTQSSYQAGVLVFRAGDSIDIVDQHYIGSTQLLRNVYIDDFIYALDSQGVAGSFSPAL
ncbi:MAG: hypothetical protein E7219_04085 [Clostridiales bacterium]|jgi:uncharacterized secreted protein with C-terminal beta-propeller domain|nr:hypothetical protein [Clostridiales bacterium]